MWDASLYITEPFDFTDVNICIGCITWYYRAIWFKIPTWVYVWDASLYITEPFDFTDVSICIGCITLHYRAIWFYRREHMYGMYHLILPSHLILPTWVYVWDVSLDITEPFNFTDLVTCMECPIHYQRLYVRINETCSLYQYINSAFHVTSLISIKR